METLDTPPTSKTLDEEVSKVSGSTGLNPVQTGLVEVPVVEGRAEEDGRRVSDGGVVVVKKNTVVETEVSVGLVEGKDRERGSAQGTTLGVTENGVDEGAGARGGTVEALVENGSKIVVECISAVDENVKDSGEKAVTQEVGAGDGRKGEEEEEEEEGGLEDEVHEFAVGDLVWGKVKSYPWWPGQIYNTSDASTDAEKYQKKDRLLVAYFDGTFAWCNPSQLKPFIENFEQLAKISSSKSFLKAVEVAVGEIGRRVEMEMTCSCVPAPESLIRPLAVNAGIKEGVVVPAGGIGKFSLSQFEPADFLAHLRDITQVVSVDNLLELLVLKNRLSAFYRAKGYNHLPMEYEPMGIDVDFEQNVGNGIVGNGGFEGQTLDINESPAEEDWLSSPVGPWLKTGLNFSQRWPGISEDKLYHRKKQRSIAELMGGDMNGKLDENNGGSVAEEGTGSGKPTSTLRKRRENRDSSLGNGRGVAEEFNVSGKSTTALRTRNTNKDSEVGNGSGVAELLIASGSRTRVLRTRNKSEDPKFGNDSVVAEGLHAFGDRARASSKRTKVKESEVVNDGDVVEVLTVSGNGTRASRKRNKTNYSEFGSDNSVAEDSILPGSGTRALRKRNKTNYAEAGNDSDSAKELNVSAKQTGESSERKKNKDSEVGNDNGKSEKAFGRSKRSSPSEPKGNTKLPGSLHATAEKNNSSDEKDGLGTDGASKLSIPLRERKKSKYLSPPYANLSPGLKRSFSLKNSEPETPKFSHTEKSISGDAGQVATSLPLVKCSGETVQKKLSKDSHIGHESSHRRSPRKPKENQGKIVIEEDNSSVNEMLTDIRCAAVEPLRMMKKQTYNTVRGFFTRLRNSCYHEGSDFVIYGNYLAGRGSRKRISADTNLVSPGKGIYKVDHPTSQGESEQKKRKRNEGKLLNSHQKSKHAGGTSDVKMNHIDGTSGETPMAALLLTFASGITLPSNDELIAKFEPFGAVNKSETEVLGDSNCAQVVFAKASDAEEAYNRSEKMRPFGSAVVSYRLRYLRATSKATYQAVSHVPVGDESSLLSVRQSLEVTKSVLEKSWDKLSSEVKANLGSDIKGLLDKVTSMVGSSSV